MKEYTRTFDDRWSFWDADTKEYTHGYHTYPAMMIPQVCRTLINEYQPGGFTHITTIVRRIPNKRMPSKTSPTNKVGNKVSTMMNEYIVILKKIL